MTLKTYNQNCGLASALDVVGERWTLLIIRSLMTGPARFNEIQSRLPGMGTNLLAERLKSLTRWNLIKKESGRQSSYMLTRKGKALRPILHLLARWGRDYVSGAGTQTDPQWAMFNIEASFCPERSEGIDAIVEFDMAGSIFHLIIRKQTCRAVVGPAAEADVSISSDSEAVLGGGGRLQIHGDTAVFDRVRPCFEL